MACWMPILPPMLDFFTSIDEWHRPKRTSYLATPCFENLRCLRKLLETIEFKNTFICMTTRVINGLRNITINSNSIVVQMDCVALLTSLLNTYFQHYAHDLCSMQVQCISCCSSLLIIKSLPLCDLISFHIVFLPKCLDFPHYPFQYIHNEAIKENI